MIFISSCCTVAFAQTEITKDTLYFLNKGKRVAVVHTLNRQYYNDSSCVWEIMYPEISGLAYSTQEKELNLLFSTEVAFGDCNEKVCDKTTMYFPLLSKYWDKVRVTGIKNDLVSYCMTEGHCPVNSKYCSGKTMYYFYNVKYGSEVAMISLFKKEETTQHKLDSIILDKLDFVPEDLNAIRNERQFYFEGDKLFVFYDWYTIGKSNTYSAELQYKEIHDLINPVGILPVFFGDQLLLKK